MKKSKKMRAPQDTLGEIKITRLPPGDAKGSHPHDAKWALQPIPPEARADLTNILIKHKFQCIEDHDDVFWAKRTHLFRLDISLLKSVNSYGPFLEAELTPLCSLDGKNHGLWADAEARDRICDLERQGRTAAELNDFLLTVRQREKQK
jgi:hypothetical protein